MADTLWSDLLASSPTNEIQPTDGVLLVRAGLPAAFNGTLPKVTPAKLEVPDKFLMAGAVEGADGVVLVGRHSVNYPANVDQGYFRLITNNTSADTGGFTVQYLAAGVYRDGLRVDGSGNLLLGVTAANQHALTKAVAQGDALAYIRSSTTGQMSAQFYAVSTEAYSLAPASIVVGKNSSTNRSINAGGTVNASGADYAEYLRKAITYIEWQFAKGQVLGINNDGELTPRWSEALSFVIKSYDPAYVGGDTWAARLGPKPEAPAPIGPKPESPAVPPFVEPMPMRADDEADEGFGLRMAEWVIASRAAAEAMAMANAAAAAYPAQLEEWTAAKAAFDAAQAAFEIELPLWEAAMEEARAIVDRIAFSGQVPVIVDGDYAPGQYLVAHEGPEDTIVCRAHDLAELLADPALAYRKVGKVWAVREVKLNPADGSETPEMVTRAWANVLHS